MNDLVAPSIIAGALTGLIGAVWAQVNRRITRNEENSQSKAVCDERTKALARLEAGQDKIFELIGNMKKDIAAVAQSVAIMENNRNKRTED